MNANLFLQNNDSLRPRDEIRVERVVATPLPERRQVKVEVDITPFRERPNFEIIIRDADKNVVASSSVIASMHFKMAFNLHLRGVNDLAGTYAVQVQLYYDDVQSPQDTCEIAMSVPPGHS